MRIITKKRLLEAAKIHPNAKSKIASWHKVAKNAVWTNLIETRKSFANADQVTLKNGRTITIFNISNDYRLITAIHYNRKMIFIRRFLTHSEYSKGKWKETI